MYTFRPRFSLRSYFVVLTAFVVLFGYLVGRAQQQKRAVTAIERLGGTVIYDYQYVCDEESSQRCKRLFEEPPDTWYVNLLGQDFFHKVVGVNGFKQHYYQSVGSVVHSFGPSRIDTAFNSDTDEALGSLTGLHSLQFLNLRETAVTDQGLKNLLRLKSLQRVDLYDCQITDKGLETLADVNDLSSVTLLRTEVTEDGVRKLAESSPGLEVWHFSTTEVRDGELVQKGAAASGRQF